ncbi:unnamed protein product [Brassicogethes aeneus]|uniref:Golgin-45 n=1 Tax=Brassicogethes aeneus TaxID=1431903 RepID=A0A9P0BBZ2_BRAAE|nr:unnamed protein product [Brassicogethes aeneus]
MEQKGIRTMGDGMDNALLSFPETLNNAITFNANLKSSKQILKSLQPVIPTSNIVQLVPKYFPKEQKAPKDLFKKGREPKFVPYEPYKAAVEPMVAPISNKVVFESKPTKNNVEIHQLVNQMADIRQEEMDKMKMTALEKGDNFIARDLWEKEKECYNNDIKNLRETNSHLENQLKFQAQVNSELKTLLVAAVGEDLESRVQHLTEDKLQLARALLNSANHLTSHQEQTEWLSGQCEVWRSKFLASSLMVEELAHWKSALTSRINELQNTIKALMEENSYTKKHSLQTYCNLKMLIDNVSDNNDTMQLKSATCVELAHTNLILADKLEKHFKVPNKNAKLSELYNGCGKIENSTFTEKNAQKLLQNPVKITNKDAICNALVGAAYGEHNMHSQNHQFHTVCCGHCKGEIQNI